MGLTASLPGRAVPSESPGFSGDWLRGDTTGWLPRHPSRAEDVRGRIAELTGREPAAEVWERARTTGQALGADGASGDAALALKSGEALCVITGQQPGLFLGPLYTVYKAMTAVALARELSERERVRIVPVFWNAGDDSDFGEVQTASLPGDGFSLTRYTLDGADLPAGGMTGDLATGGTRRALEEARSELAGRPSGDPVVRHLEAALSRAGDHGDLTTALLHDLFSGTGLVVVDGRWEELRRGAAPLFGRWAPRRDEAARAILAGGKELRESGYRPRIAEAQTRNGLFEIREGIRVPFEGSAGQLARRIAEAPETLSPNVTLRALVQDFLLPTVATVVGSSELAYHAQLAGVYELLEVGMPVLFPRFEATLVPSGVRDLASRRGQGVEAFVRDFDGAMRATADRALPDALREALAELEGRVAEGLERTRAEAEAFSPKLSGALPDAEKRVREAIGKIREKAAAAARAEEVRRDPAVRVYREFLRPRGVPQERVVSALTLFLESEAHPLDCLDTPLGEHLRAVREGRPLHWLLDFGGCRGDGG